jgi:phospholipid transport system substrate-binding protein
MSAFVNNLFAILVAALVFSIGFYAPPAQAQQDHRDVIIKKLKNRDAEIKAILGDETDFTDTQREELKYLINGAIDFEKMGQDALGSQWDKLTAEQHAEFVKVFSEIVQGRSLADLEIYRLDVTYDDVKVEGENARVMTTTIYKDQPMKVEYAMGLRNDEWRVDDIILDGVSTTDGYARSFQTYVRKRGFDALMTNLHKRLAKINGTS